jgi:hypothetical protein
MNIKDGEALPGLGAPGFVASDIVTGVDLASEDIQHRWRRRLPRKLRLLNANNLAHSCHDPTKSPSPKVLSTQVVRRKMQSNKLSAHNEEQ